MMRNRVDTYKNNALFQALADPTRRAVLDLLRGGSMPAGGIAQQFPISRPAISKHLRLLRRARLVEQRRDGRRRFYELNAEPLQAVDSWLEYYRAFWSANLRSLKQFVESEYDRETAPKEARENARSSRRKQRTRGMGGS